MKVLPTISAALLLLACASQEQLERDRLIDTIESRVKLPEGARRLSNYARYYASDGHGMVVGVYVPGYQAPDPGDSCGELLEDFSMREIPCPSEEKGSSVLAGQRRWLENKDELPLIMDGGCSVVSLIYDPKVGEVKKVECNGEA